ncbi:MAG: alpha/beta hydrolase [Sphingomonadales bacterium]|nr:alpha/beta hydrolase [Sphingomonadales bacterium]
MRLGMWLAMIATLAGGSALAAGNRVFPVADKPVLEDRYPARVTHWAKGVSSLADVVYQQLPGYRPQVVDIYMPPSGKGPRPLVLYVHGGGWVAGHTRHSGAMADFPAALAELASEGFVVASLEYRLADEARFPAQVQDARAALRFLRANAARYGIDASRAAIWGGSAGGHLSALTALSCGEASLEAKGVSAPAGSECVQAAAIWYGVFDFAALAASRPGGSDAAAARLLGCNGPCTAADYAPASPVTYIDAKDPPFLLIHGEEDQTVPVAQSHLVEARLRAAGVPVTAIYIPGVDHSFIGRSAAETRTATLRAINATYDFFHRTLDRPGR